MRAIIAPLALNKVLTHVVGWVENNLERRADIFLLMVKPLVINACRKLKCTFKQGGAIVGREVDGALRTMNGRR